MHNNQNENNSGGIPQNRNENVERGADRAGLQLLRLHWKLRFPRRRVGQGGGRRGIPWSVQEDVWGGRRGDGHSRMRFLGGNSSGVSRREGEMHDKLLNILLNRFNTTINTNWRFIYLEIIFFLIYQLKILYAVKLSNGKFVTNFIFKYDNLRQTHHIY